MTATINRIVLFLGAAAVPAWPQVHFEVASIRPSQPGMTAQDSSKSFHGDRFEAKAMTVGDLLDMLNGFQLFRVAGGPDWIRTERYDIEAKADRALELAGLQQAVMGLLTERFQLKSHRETRELPGFVLQAPRLPPGLKEAGTDERPSMHMDGADFVFTAWKMSGLTDLLPNLLMAPVW